MVPLGGPNVPTYLSYCLLSMIFILPGLETTTWNNSSMRSSRTDSSPSMRPPTAVSAMRPTTTTSSTIVNSTSTRPNANASITIVTPNTEVRGTNMTRSPTPSPNMTNISNDPSIYRMITTSVQEVNDTATYDAPILDKETIIIISLSVSSTLVVAMICATVIIVLVFRKKGSADIHEVPIRTRTSFDSDFNFVEQSEKVNETEFIDNVSAGKAPSLASRYSSDSGEGIVYEDVHPDDSYLKTNLSSNSLVDNENTIIADNGCYQSSGTSLGNVDMMIKKYGSGHANSVLDGPLHNGSVVSHAGDIGPSDIANIDQNNMDSELSEADSELSAGDNSKQSPRTSRSSSGKTLSSEGSNTSFEFYDVIQMMDDKLSNGRITGQSADQLEERANFGDNGSGHKLSRTSSGTSVGQAADVWATSGKIQVNVQSDDEGLNAEIAEILQNVDKSEYCVPQLSQVPPSDVDSNEGSSTGSGLYEDIDLDDLYRLRNRNTRLDQLCDRNDFINNNPILQPIVLSTTEGKNPASQPKETCIDSQTALNGHGVEQTGLMGKHSGPFSESEIVNLRGYDSDNASQMSHLSYSSDESEKSKHIYDKVPFPRPIYLVGKERGSPLGDGTYVHIVRGDSSPDDTVEDIFSDDVGQEDNLKIPV